MKQEDIERMAKLRGWAMDYYEKLDRGSPGVSMTKTAEVAYFCESLIESLSHILKPYVNFSEK